VCGVHTCVTLFMHRCLFLVDRGKYNDGLVHPVPSGPHWQRFNTPRDERRIRVWCSRDVPRVSTVKWTAKQHSSPVLRPADFVVYVGDDDGNPDRLLAGIASHLPTQGTETLHAIAIFGAVCGENNEYVA
jgi:hypothetical protein